MSKLELAVQVAFEVGQWLDVLHSSGKKDFYWRENESVYK